MSLFCTICEISLTTSLVLAVLLILSPLLSRRYRPQLRCMCWLAVAIRLLIPWRLSLPDAPVQLSSAPAPGTPAPFAFVYGAPDTVPGTAAGPDPLALLAVLWAVGAAVYLALRLGAHLRMMHHIRRWKRPAAPPECTAGQELPIPVYTCKLLTSPMLAGLFHPAVYLPDRDYLPEQWRTVVQHELTHHRHRDLWYRAVLLLCCGVHWFNPLVHLMARLAVCDLELYCDSDLLEGASAAERRGYAQLLLGSISAVSGIHSALTSQFRPNLTHLKRRFGNILNLKYKKQGTAVLCTLLCSIAAVGLLVGFSDGSSAAASSAIIPADALTVRTEPDAGARQRTAPDPAAPAESQISGELCPSSALDGQNSASQNGDRSVQPPIPLCEPIPGAMVSAGYSQEHGAVDFAAAEGTDILAAAAGTVVKVDTLYHGYGKHLILDHGNGCQTLYGHCSELLVEVGDTVEAGEVIARVGRTGNATGYCCHFEYRQNDSALNPAEYIA